MKSRNDRVLYSGMSTAITRVEERRAERSREKESLRRVLEPSAELFVRMIEKARLDIPLELMKLIQPDTPKEQANNIIACYGLYDKKLSDFKTVVDNTMRIKESSNE